MRPGGRRRRAQLGPPALDEGEGGEGRHRLADREDVHEGVALPRARPDPVRPPGPQVDDEPAFDGDRDRRTNLAVVTEIPGQRAAHLGKALIARAADLGDVGHRRHSSDAPGPWYYPAVARADLELERAF